ncbi:hypothetical protein PSM36_3150 [Proteiniphilum saccharofermentans]|uniref:Heparinase II/III-like protein n=1 Tax=Proteiniphilum saccharofermentans TaxID=1642647 RepID=A0A1R3T767_9BACT|nr:heparinase II/III family protein [Proteiniphilum saccharofermentans]SCD21939.1 hypothetical protein PSM36_3150 [Proteiniphilum saccharofermentans]SFS31707.1 Heparinase II/III-like protein [Porphyromonadaceae bacterium NLAE-zl-C104]
MSRVVVFLFTLCAGIFYSTGQNQHEHPRLLVKDTGKKYILDKIEQHEWAKSIFNEHYDKVSPYVERHQSDPEWILGRYLMNRVEGKRYTHAYDDGTGHYIVRYSGDAPVPTVRVSTHKRNPVTESGAPYVMPSLEELVPNDTSMYIWALNTETNKKDFIDPQQFVSIINGEINDLALSAAVIYWLKEDESYARFAADILDQWAQGVFYQEPIIGACRTGLLDIQTLGDNRYQSLILAYDFLYPFLKKEGYELSRYQHVFEKFASTLTFRGFWNNNWYAAVSATLVYAVLSLDDKEKQDYYLQFVLERDTIDGSCGRLSLATTVKEWLTPDGHWKEPGGYHNFPVSNLIKAAFTLEKNGYPVFQQYPELFDATYAMLKYSFPNLYVSAFGDTGRAFQSPETLEIGLVIATEYNRPEVPGMMAAMNTITGHGMYDRSKSGLMGLLTYLPDFPEGVSQPYVWARSGELDFARFYFQRNGTDEKQGLMYGVQGASYNHNHCNGMAMELYGCGEVMGIDAGTGPNYEHPLHQGYFSQWAAHNTVVAAGRSSSIPFSGAAGKKNIGQVELAAMEPLPGKNGVSPYHSFTDTRYLDISTHTNQLRTMGIIRTSDSTGYYIDIFRSDNQISNDYVYHNIGDSFVFSGQSGNPLQMESAKYPLVEEDYPGFRFFTDVEKMENVRENVRGLFSAKDRQGQDIFMHVFLPASDKVYYRAKSPAVRTGGRQYFNRPLPLFTVRSEEEAWTEPFICIFEPSVSKENNTIVSVERIAELCDSENTVIRVWHKDGSAQIIFQGNCAKRIIKGDHFSFSGSFGVISTDVNGNLESLYLGEGHHIAYSDVKVKSIDAPASVFIRLDDKNEYSVSGNQPVKIDLSGTIINYLLTD